DPVGQTIKTGCCTGQNLMRELWTEHTRECPFRGVEVPVWVISREHHPIRQTTVLEKLQQMSWIVGFLNRLGRVPDVISHVFRRPALEVRGRLVQHLPCGVEGPRQRRRPPDACLDEDDPKVRKLFEDAFEDHTLK